MAATNTNSQVIRGKIELRSAGEASSPEQNAGFYQSRIMTVASGQVLATVVAGETDQTTELGPNVAISPDGSEVLATACGQLCFEEGRIWVEQGLEIAGDVDFGSGNIDFAHDVLIYGSVLDLFSVKSAGSVLVRKVVEAAQVVAGVDLTVSGGIVGKEKGTCSAGRDLRARYVSNATLEAGRDVIIQSQISNTIVKCGRKLAVHGPILAGRCHAAGGITCRALGSESGLATLVSAGTDERFEQAAGPEVVRIEEKLLQAERVRQTVEPLMRNQKQLTPAQKEKATELLYNAAEVQEEAAKRLSALRQQFEQMQSQACPKIQVVERVHPGVTIRLPGVETVIVSPIRGPVDIVLRKMGTQPRIVAVNPRTGSGSPLETHAVKEPACEVVQRLLARTAA